MKIIIPGGAGLVGQNLVVRMKERGYKDIVVLDKHKTNLAILKEIQPDIIAEYADLAEAGVWQAHFSDADVVVMLQAQIGGNDLQKFKRNNVETTRHILDAVKTHNIRQLIHVSSSVVESVAKDFYTTTKTEQENLIKNSSVSSVILRPTLMFGWFDRKHLGWLSRFMNIMPVFPIPGNGRFMRQPLYAGDFCNIIISCISNHITSGEFDISGHEKVDYIDIIREIKQATQSRTLLLNIPYRLFYILLWVWALFDKNPPFTTQQLEALVARDEFEVIDWPKIFDVSYKPFSTAIDETFNHHKYSQIVLDF